MKKRIVSILLLVSMLLVGCNDTPKQSEKTMNENAQRDAGVSADGSAQTSETEEHTITDEIREKYKDVNYDGASITIAGYEAGTFFYSAVGSTFNEVMYEEQTGDAYVDAVYERNTNTEDLLNIKIKAEFIPSSTTVAKALSTCVTSGDNNIDMGVGSLCGNIEIAVQNIIYNLSDIDAIETEAPWFDQGIIKNYSYRNKYLYAITGAYTVYDDYSVPTIYYDKDLLALNTLEDPADLVMEGKWTIDAMMTMGETVVRDVNGDGEMTTDTDIFGLFDNGDMLPHFMEGTGNLKTKIAQDGIPYVNCLTSEYIDTAEIIFNRVISSPAAVINPECGVMGGFNHGRVLFSYELLATINMLRERDGNFSILPLPKKDEAQEQYVSPVNSAWCTSFAIPVSVQDTERAGTVINVLNALAMDTVNSVLYEQILGAKLFREEKSLIMLDYLLNNKQYCWANAYSCANPIDTYISGYAQNTTFVLASTAKKMEKSINKALEKFLAQFDEVVGITE